MDYQFLTKEEQADILRARLRSLESEHLQQTEVLVFAGRALAAASSTEEETEMQTILDRATRVLRQLDLAHAETLATYQTVSHSSADEGAPATANPSPLTGA